MATAKITSTGSGYVAKLNAKTGLYFDLPTEAMWEVAAHATGKPTDRFYFGDNPNDLPKYGKMTQGIVPVGCYIPNQWGLYDVCENAGEWCLDIVPFVGGATGYTINTSGMSLTQTPAYSGTAPVWRGGRCGNAYEWAASSSRARDHNSCNYSDIYFGSRISLIVQ